MGPTISTASFHVTTSLQFPFPPPRFRFLLAMSPDVTPSDQRRAQSPKSPNSTATATANNQPSLLVFSGGTAFNGVVEELKKFTTRVAHVLPVSDDGGSTAEIVRVLGGPAVGDIRSRCLRLSDESTAEALAVRTLLGHRLPVDADKAKSEWFEIVECKHTLWTGVSKPYSETIRAFLVYFQNEILRRADDKNTFCFSNGSIGNFFFAGARIFFVSLDAAIFLFSRVSGIPAESEVLPVISTNERLTLACKLWNETIIRGQNEISHPSSGLMEPTKKDVSSSPALPARIKRVYYLSSEGTGQEVFPSPHPRVLERLMEVDCIVYSMGSLFTSICPSLVLRGIGEKIASRSCPKVLILNGSLDRETANFTASCFVTAITEALNRSYGKFGNIIGNSPQDYINTLLVPKGGQVEVDREQLDRQGIIKVITVDSVNDEKMGPVYDPKSIIQALAELLTE